MAETNPITPKIDSQPTLPGYSPDALNLIPELRNRVAERAALDHISDEEALRRLTDEGIKFRAEERLKNHAP
jgi:hypothetical protein